MFRKVISILLIPLFLLSNLTIAGAIDINRSTLAPPMLSALLADSEVRTALENMPDIGGRNMADRIEDVAGDWLKMFAQKLVSKKIEIIRGDQKSVDVDKIHRDIIEKELKGQINALVQIKKIHKDLANPLIAAVARELRPGALAGFTGMHLDVDVHGVNVRNLFDDVIKKLVTSAEPVVVKDLINEQRHSELTSSQLDLKIYAIENLITEFKEMFREELKKKGFDEPTREEMINEYALEVISHPGISRESIYIDELYYRILTNPEWNENWQDLMIELIKHEDVHIRDRNISEDEAHKIAPINNVVKALKKRTILLAMSGGDCAGLNAVVATSAEELPKKGFIAMGVKEGFVGLTSDNFNSDYRISLDIAQADRIRERPSTELFSSREAPFKAADWYKLIIGSTGDVHEQRRYINNLAKIKKIVDWNQLTDEENKALEDMLITLNENAENISDKKLKESKDKEKDVNKAFVKFFNFMKHIDEYGGLIVTGGDDHCRIALKVSEFGRMGVAIPKSIDNDAMTQMLGFYKTAKHFLGRFFLGAVTGKGKYKVFIAEIMGRAAGWLALAAGDRAGRVPAQVLKTLGNLIPGAGKKKAEFVKNTTISIVPEKTTSILTILKRAHQIYKKHGAINISVSEGYKVDPADPLLSELRRKNPLIDYIWKRVESGDIETDVHGHPKLEGASDFIFAIIATRWEENGVKNYDTGITPDQIKHAIFGYTGRGLKPGTYDVAMGVNLTRLAVELIDQGKSGWMAMYPDKGLHPYTDKPIARPVSEVLDDINGYKYPKDLSTLGSDQEEIFKENDLVVRGFRMLPDAELTGRGVLLETNGKVDAYPLRTEFEVIPDDTVLDFTTAVKLLREDMISSNISANTNRRSSIFEVPDGKGYLTLALSDKNPPGYYRWSNVDKASWEKLRPKIMGLVPGQENPLKDIVKEAVEIREKYGVVFIVVGSGYKFSEEDKEFMDLIEGDAYLSTKYDMFAKPAGKDGDQVTVNYISHYLRAALMKYSPENFKTKSSANCNLLGQMYEVKDPSEEKKALIFSEPVIENIEEITKETENHLLLGDECALDTKKMVVIANKNMTNFSIDVKDRTAVVQMNDQYQVMKQSLSKMFADGEGYVEVSDSEELTDRANKYIGKGYKVIILDDNRNTNGTTASRLSGEQGSDYCIVTYKRTESLSVDEMPFINLNAMAMMGVGLLNKDYRLFALAYRNFTGEEPSEQTIEMFESDILWLISLMPRIVRLTGDLVDQRILKRLFAAAA